MMEISIGRDNSTKACVAMPYANTRGVAETGAEATVPLVFHRTGGRMDHGVFAGRR